MEFFYLVRVTRPSRVTLNLLHFFLTALGFSFNNAAVGYFSNWRYVSWLNRQRRCAILNPKNPWLTGRQSEISGLRPRQ